MAMATATPSLPFPAPQGGASLLLSFKPASRTVLVIGSNRLAAARAFAALEADARVVVASHGGVQSACDELRWRVSNDQVEWVDTNTLETHESALQLLDSIEDIVLVCITDTLLDASARPRSLPSASAIAAACRTRHIPLNVADLPHLCDFTFPSTHRFPAPAAGRQSSLQLAVTANGQGCRLASRVRREVVMKLPRTVGDAVERVGRLRRMAKASDLVLDECSEKDEDAAYPAQALNAPVEQYDPVLAAEDRPETARRRMRWVAQVSEYWSFDALAGMKDEEMRRLLSLRPEEVGTPGVQGKPGEVVDEGYWSGTGSVRAEPRPRKGRCPSRSRPADSSDASPSSSSAPSSHPLAPQPGAAQPTSTTPSVPPHDPTPTPDPIPSHHSLTVPLAPSPPKHGRILLVGSGPGHPSLLTLAAHTALTKLATLVLSDKLVPSQVLELIPPTTSVYIAKKFPGNAEGAQNELMEMAVHAAERGETVVRLKQGDPFLYGRGGEEVLHFRSHGFPPLLIPGLSSALAGPLLAGIPVTQRGVAESLTVCTGVGRQGRDVVLPGYERARTLCVLMGVARMAQLLRVMMAPAEAEAGRKGAKYPAYTPIAIVERASCPDQRVIASTLERIEEALERVGEQRAPGMIVVGWAVLALDGEGDVSVLDEARREGEGEEREEERDRERVRRWVGEKGYVVREGIEDGWGMF